jgi:hypothetical protein
MDGLPYIVMGSHMKTTVEISDALLFEAKKVAAREGTTVRTLIEQGLRQALAGRAKRGHFKLRKATFKGRGLGAGAHGASSRMKGAADDRG